jgi:16S rRNA (guanine527-N7)-methyltransferase
VDAGQSNAELSELIGAAAADVGVPLAAAQLEPLATHFRLLLQWNQKINLTAVRAPREIATRHFGESLFLSTLIAAPVGTIVDVGSGGGFPGLPLQVVWPRAECVLIESNQKKATFLREVVRQAGLLGARVECARAEDAARGALAGACALVTMRAVALDDAMLDCLGKLLGAGGLVALFAGAEDAQRLFRSIRFAWRAPQPIPHGQSRVILIGERG